MVSSPGGAFRSGGRFAVGVQLKPQHCTIAELRAAWRAADAMGADSIWTWDHFFPLDGDPNGPHFEGWTLLAAMASDTQHARLGVLVSCNSYRSPDLVADMARTIDHLSGGRVILGLGAGWNQRDYEQYGFEFGTVVTRVAALEPGIDRIKARLASLNPPPLGPLPLMIGGEGETVTLRVTAAKADIWNGFGPVEKFARKNRVLDEWCSKVGRDPAAVERSVMVGSQELDDVERFLEAGAQHLIVSDGAPFTLRDLGRLLDIARRSG